MLARAGSIERDPNATLDAFELAAIRTRAEPR